MGFVQVQLEVVAVNSSAYPGFCSGLKNIAKYLFKIFWGKTLNQSSAVHIPALVSANIILPGSSSNFRLLVINVASVIFPLGQTQECVSATILQWLKCHFLFFHF